MTVVEFLEVPLLVRVPMVVFVVRMGMLVPAQFFFRVLVFMAAGVGRVFMRVFMGVRVWVYMIVRVFVAMHGIVMFVRMFMFMLVLMCMFMCVFVLFFVSHGRFLLAVKVKESMGVPGKT
jgi:hypothetical protein